MTHRILVTGGSGYLGTHIRGYFGADDFSRRSGRDLNHPDDLLSVAEYDVVIHLAGCVDKSPDAESRCFEVNVAGTANLLRHLRPGQVFIFASTKDVYGRNADARELVNEECPTQFNGHHAYDWSKLVAEKYVEYYCAQRAVRSAIFRLSTTYAPPSQGNKGTFVNYFAKAVREGLPLTLRANGRQVRDFLHVNDLASAFERFIGSDLPSEVFNIGGGQSNWTTLLELTEILGGLLGRSPVVDLSPEPEPAQMRFITDTRKLERRLGWRTEYSLEEGLKTIL